MITRLSAIYKVSTALDVRDDTLHLFFGPYHICLGSAMYAAQRFKNISNALLATSNTKTNKIKDKTSNNKRQRETRFRRLTHKLILIKSILNQLRSSSILTLYNQYALSNNGIYELVLAGDQQNVQSMFDDPSSRKELDRLQTMYHPEETSYLLSSNFIKINALLHLLSATIQENESNTAHTHHVPTQSNESTSLTSNNVHTKSLLNEQTVCCSHHHQPSSLIAMPLVQPTIAQATARPSTSSTSRRSNSQSLIRAKAILSRQNTVNFNDS
jgi:hypothetical protein